MGRGLGFGLRVAPRDLAVDLGPEPLTIIPVFGFASSHIAVDGLRPEERFNHGFYALELGVAAQWGVRKRHFEVLAAYAPSLYHSAVDVESSREGSATEAAWMNVRVAAGYRFHFLYAGAAARVLSGPTFWFEPLTVGLTASF